MNWMKHKKHQPMKFKKGQLIKLDKAISNSMVTLEAGSLIRICWADSLLRTYDIEDAIDVTLWLEDIDEEELVGTIIESDNKIIEI